MNELTLMEKNSELATVVEQQNKMLAVMAEMIRSNNERMAKLEAELRMLVKVTPSQLSALTKALKARAADVCRMHRCVGKEKAAGNAIRHDLRQLTGVRSMRDLPRCDYENAMKAIEMWDDFVVMTRIRKGE